MAQLIVRNVGDGVKSRLQTRARRNGRSMEEEVREILRSAVHETNSSPRGLGTELSALFVDSGLESGITELRGHQLKPARFRSSKR